MKHKIEISNYKIIEKIIKLLCFFEHYNLQSNFDWRRSDEYTIRNTFYMLFIISSLIINLL